MHSNRAHSNPPRREVAKRGEGPTMRRGMLEQERLPRGDFEGSQRLFESSEADRAQLVKRINALLVEVDRLNNDRTSILQQLHEERLRSEDQQRRLRHASKNRGTDFKYERDENNRLKHLLHNMEIERTELRSKLKDYETATASFTYEKQDITAKLQQRIDHISIIESDNRVLVERSNALQNKLAHAEHENEGMRHDRALLQDAVQRLEAENAELLSHVHAEVARCDQYHAAKTNEIENMRWIQRRHIRLVASRNIALELQKFLIRRLNSTWRELSASLALSEGQGRGVQRVIAAFSKYCGRETARYFSRWRAQLNWRHAHSNRSAMADRLCDRNALGRFFADWRNAFHSRVRTRQRQVLAIGLLFKRLDKDRVHSLRGRFLLWKHIHIFVKNRDYSYGRLRLRVFVGQARSGLARWRAFAGHAKHLQAKEDLATEFAGTMTKSVFFKALKEHVQQCNYERKLLQHKELTADKLMQINVLNRLRRYVAKKQTKDRHVRRVVRRWVHKDEAKALAKWKTTLAKTKTIERTGKVLANKARLVSQITAEKLFYVWKQWKLNNSFKDAKQKYEIAEPRRIALEREKENLQDEALRNSQIKAGRAVSKQLHIQVSSYLHKWRKTTQFFSFSKSLVFRMIKRQVTSRLSGCFFLWNKQAKDRDILELCAKAEATIADNVQQAQEINALNSEIGHREEHRVEIAGRVLKRTANYLAKKDLTGAIRRWARNALHLGNVIIAGGILEKRFRSYFFKDGVNQILQKSIDHKREESRKKRLQHYLMVLFNKTHREFFDAWVYYIQQRRSFKKDILKALKRKIFNYLQQSMGIWKKAIRNEVESELNTYNSQLEDHRRTLQRSLTMMTAEFEETSKKLKIMQKKLSKNCQKRVKNAFQRCLSGALAAGFQKWVGYIQNQNLQAGKSNRLIKIWNKNWKRRSWRTWNLFIKNKIKVTSEREIKRLHDESKKANREHKTVVADFQEQVELREQLIKNYESEVQRLRQRGDFLMTRGIKQMQTEYSDNRATFAFLAWKDQYLDLRTKMWGLSRRITSSQIRRSFRMIKTQATENTKLSELRMMLIGICRKYKFRFTKNIFNTWHRNSHALAQKKLEVSYKKEAQTAAELRHHQSLVANKTFTKFLTMLISQNKQQMFTAWASITQKMKAIRLATAEYELRLRHKRSTWAISKLLERRERGHLAKRKRALAGRHTLKELLKRIFKEWKNLHLKYGYVKQVFNKLWNRHLRDKMHEAMTDLKVTYMFKKTHGEWHARTQHSVLSKRMRSIMRYMLGKAFRKWIDHSYYKASSQSMLRGVMLRALHRKLKRGMALWEESYIVTNVARHVNREGPVAVENESLKNRVKIMNELVKEEGIDPKYVEKYILEKENLVDSLKMKKLARTAYMKGEVNRADSSLVPRMFLIWKMWVIKRKKIKTVVHRMLAYKKNGPVMHAFLTWKQGLPLVVNSINKLTRKQLFGLVAKMDRDIKTLEGRLEMNHRDVVYLQTYSNILECQTRKGQNQALTSCAKNVRATLMKGMLRWSVHTNLSKIHDLLESLTRLEDEHLNLKAFCKSVEEENKAIVEDNMELRQASLDGIAIADAFETLTKEREHLSVDLADRAATIKRLLEENSMLTHKLMQSGIEDFGADVARGYNKY